MSEQISTAGYEAERHRQHEVHDERCATRSVRATAQTIGDGRAEAGEENFFLFGLNAQQVAESAGWYDPRLLDGGDFYRHLADLKDYGRAHRELDSCYADRSAWDAKAIRNVASSGKFSSDRTIREYGRRNLNLRVSAVSSA